MSIKVPDTLNGLSLHQHMVAIIRSFDMRAIIAELAAVCEIESLRPALNHERVWRLRELARILSTIQNLPLITNLDKQRRP